MARKTFKKIIDLCYDEQDCIELHQEILSIEVGVKSSKDFNKAIEDVISSIPLYTDDFPAETMGEIENIYEDYLDSLEN